MIILLFDFIILLNDVNVLSRGVDDEILYECLELSLDDMFVVVSIFLGIIDVEFNLGDRIVVVEVIFMLLLFVIIGKNIL